MRIVDSQVHAWIKGESTGHHRRSPITREVLEAEMALAGVERVVLVPPLWDPDGNAYALALAQAQPERFAVMGLLDPNGADLEERVRGWREQPRMLGMRLLLNTHDRMQPLLDGRLAGVWPVAERTGLIVAMLVPGGLHLVAAIARRHPALRIIVDHLGIPRGACGPAAFDHLPQLLALAALPNIHVKAAALGDYALDPYPFPSLDEPLRRVFDAFGPQRILWGSDLSRLHHSYRQCVTHLLETVPWLSGPDRALIMGANTCRLLGWD
jgi:L-fuconolactonase